MQRRAREQYVGRFLKLWLRGKSVFNPHGIMSMCHYFPILKRGEIKHIKYRESV